MSTYAEPQIKEGDEITVGDIIVTDDGIVVWHGAPPESLAKWRCSPKADGNIALTLLSKGKVPTTPPGPHFEGCGCGWRK